MNCHHLTPLEIAKLELIQTRAQLLVSEHQRLAAEAGITQRMNELKAEEHKLHEAIFTAAGFDLAHMPDYAIDWEHKQIRHKDSQPEPHPADPTKVAANGAPVPDMAAFYPQAELGASVPDVQAMADAIPPRKQKRH